MLCFKTYSEIFNDIASELQYKILSCRDFKVLRILRRRNLSHWQGNDFDRVYGCMYIFRQAWRAMFPDRCTSARGIGSHTRSSWPVYAHTHTRAHTAPYNLCVIVPSPVEAAVTTYQTSLPHQLIPPAEHRLVSVRALATDDAAIWGKGSNQVE